MSYFTHVLLPVLGMFILCASFIVFMIQGGVGAAKYTSTTTHGVAVSTMVYIQYFVVGAVMLIAGVGLLIFQKIKALGL
ncbi:hypothetical protein FACS1894166_08080 [Bacilli bacterium]|nr:hypothetical protein FACS1894166_08080 [Bacilli bacterium]